MTNGKEDFIDVRAVAGHLGVAKSFVYKLASEKKLPYYRPKGSSKLLFKLSEVDLIMEKEYRYA